jgi:hypothetical protein
MVQTAENEQLIRHCGAELVTPEELRAYQAPPPQGRWYPLEHSTVYERVTSTLTDAGFVIESQPLAVSSEGNRFFGTLDLQSKLADGITHAVGIGNSVEKVFNWASARGAGSLSATTLPLPRTFLSAGSTPSMVAFDSERIFKMQ